MPSFPPLFLSHGAPNMGLHDTPVREFMMGLGKQFQKPKAIVICSAHFETDGTAVVTDPSPETTYDFHGFEPELYQVKYPAPGDPLLAEQVVRLLQLNDIKTDRISKRGFDHGTWVPLSLAWPNADIPVVQVSIDPNKPPQYHYQTGKALSSLADQNIAVIGTGNITHNLHAIFGKGQNSHLDENIKRFVDEFLSWFDSELESGSPDKLLNYRENAPHAVENHPTDEHLLPIFVALGAAGNEYTAEKLHKSFTFDFLAMDAWAFHTK